MKTDSANTILARLLTVVIPSYSRTDLLESCLTALRRCGASDAGIAILVVDDGSPAERVSRCAARFAGVRIVRRAERGGFCAAANTGLREATTPLVQLLNDDAEVVPNWWPAAVRRLVGPGNVAAVAPLVLQWPGRRIDSAGDDYDPGGFARKRGHGQRLGGWFRVAEPVASAAGCGAFYRRAAVLQVGGFPEDFIAHFDDVDLCCRLRRAGYSVWYEPDARILHHGSASYGRRLRAPAVARQSCNEERLFWRNLHGPRCAAHLLRHALVLAGKAYLRWHEGNLRPFLAGRLRAWAELLPGARP